MSDEDEIVRLQSIFFNQSSTVEFRLKVLRDAGEFEMAIVLPLLRAALRDDNELIRRRAVLGLNQPDNEETLELLLYTLEDKSTLVVKAALETLAEVGHSKAIMPVMRLLETGSVDKFTDLTGLTEFMAQNCTDIFDRVLSLLVHDDPERRLVAAQILGSSGNRRAVFPLMDALENDGAMSVRSAAAMALGDLGDERAVPSLVNTFFDLQSDAMLIIRVQAALAFDLAEVALPTLLEYATDPNALKRKRAISVMGSIDDPRSRAALYHAILDMEPDIADFAALRLGHWGDRHALSRLLVIAAADGHKYQAVAVNALGNFGAEATTTLRSALYATERVVRLNAVTALA